jgi:hypothetical protein
MIQVHDCSSCRVESKSHGKLTLCHRLFLGGSMGSRHGIHRALVRDVKSVGWMGEQKWRPAFADVFIAGKVCSNAAAFSIV